LVGSGQQLRGDGFPTLRLGDGTSTGLDAGQHLDVNLRGKDLDPRLLQPQHSVLEDLRLLDGRE
jgi:hypothetical protein